MSALRPLVVVFAAMCASVVTVSPAGAIKVLAFGDSLTSGTGDETGEGYPGRLEAKLEEGSEVEAHGVLGEETSAGLSRLPGVLDLGGDVILLLEGTNDISKIAQGDFSVESTIANVAAMLDASQEADVEPILASVIPRPDRAKRDPNNSLTRLYVGELRELAFQRNVRFTDAFDLFDPALLPEGFEDYYWANPEDFVGHLNGAGYERLATAFADVLSHNDTAAPVVGNFEPGPLPNVIRANTTIRVPIYDFSGGAGLDLAETKLLINGNVVTDGTSSEGSVDGVYLVHKGSRTLGCRAVLHVMAQDAAEPPNQLDRPIAIYGIKGRAVTQGDVNFDCRVDGLDLVNFSLGFGVDASDPRYAFPFDLDRNGVIDEADLALLAQNFGKTSE